MLKPVYALAGESSYLQLEKLGELLRMAPPDTQRLDMEGDSAQLADVFDELRSFAMFGGSKVLIMRDGEEFISRFREQVEGYLANPSTSATLVLRCNKKIPSNQRVYKLLQKCGEIIDCDPPKDVVRWIIARAKDAHALTVNLDVAQLIFEFIGNDMGRIDNELAKLALTGKQRIALADIEESVAFQAVRPMWDLTNALSMGNKEEAVRRWRQLLQMEKSAEFRGITWLSLWLENVRRALELLRQGIAPGAIAKELRIWPASMGDSFITVARHLGDAGVCKAMAQLAEIDYQSKTGVGDAAENVERFLLALPLR
jgi:DNA polymerase-3 subunit delta